MSRPGAEPRQDLPAVVVSHVQKTQQIASTFLWHLTLVLDGRHAARPLRDLLIHRSIDNVLIAALMERLFRQAVAEDCAPEGARVLTDTAERTAQTPQIGLARRDEAAFLVCKSYFPDIGLEHFFSARLYH